MAFNSIAVNYDPELIIVIINDLCPLIPLSPPSIYLPLRQAHKTDDRQKVIPHILHKLLNIQKPKNQIKKFYYFFASICFARVSSIFLSIFYNTKKKNKKKGIQNISLRYI